jgi:hypothetical protein
MIPCVFSDSEALCNEANKHCQSHKNLLEFYDLVRKSYVKKQWFIGITLTLPKKKLSLLETIFMNLDK